MGYLGRKEKVVLVTVTFDLHNAETTRSDFNKGLIQLGLSPDAIFCGDNKPVKFPDTTYVGVFSEYTDAESARNYFRGKILELLERLRISADFYVCAGADWAYVRDSFRPSTSL